MVLKNEDGYELWLRYNLIEDEELLASYRQQVTHIKFNANTPIEAAAQAELERGLDGLLGPEQDWIEKPSLNGAVVCGTPTSSGFIDTLDLKELASVGDEGYVIKRHKMDVHTINVIAANTDKGLLYGVFAFLRLLQTHQSLDGLHIVSAPKVKLRMLNHWDNLDGTIERGFAGHSLWDWHKLPHFISPRYTDYARACASIGLNATVLTNVNANALILTEPYLHKVAALAEVFRPYGVQVFLTARFSAPMEIGGLSTADPLDADVAAWWKDKVDQIYNILPDFGGFVVKANSEGQPGPHDYGRIHADGANMLADALEPHGGICIWRAFVYDADVKEDRFKQANSQLVPQDGTFKKNALLQVKNGPIDFQPREPHHPLFGAMPKTPLMLEVQITQEYLGFATHLVYLAPLFKETLNADTYCDGAGSIVARVVDGSLDGHDMSGMAAVTNIGDDRNWCGHPFAAANWYAYGRLAWDYELSSEQIADEWLRMTFSNDEQFVKTAIKMMIDSREAVVKYMMPLGLHHIFEVGHHYGPGPWVDGIRPDWTAVYYHQADAESVGFDRTATGSDAVSLYNPPYRDQLANVDSCPENMLLWFHHVPWDYRMKSGRTLWDEMCLMYQEGVDDVRQMQQTWQSLEGKIDTARYKHVSDLLMVQEREARWWRDACITYFQSFHGKPIPDGVEPPEHDLDYYRSIVHYYVPGIPERRFGKIGSN
ncbi:MAG: alpha-glucuronidase [Anaerolineaceae bacterium]|nr:alpha-glucuronidase [Anaerolineaceae bacterium]